MVLPEFLGYEDYGFVRIKGSRIGLHHVVRLYKEGRSCEEIHDEYDSLSLPLIQNVIDYYRKNTGEVDVYVAEQEADYERQSSTPRKGPSVGEMERRWKERGLGELP